MIITIFTHFVRKNDDLIIKRLFIEKVIHSLKINNDLFSKDIIIKIEYKKFSNNLNNPCIRIFQKNIKENIEKSILEIPLLDNDQISKVYELYYIHMKNIPTLIKGVIAIDHFLYCFLTFKYKKLDMIQSVNNYCLGKLVNEIQLNLKIMGYKV